MKREWIPSCLLLTATALSPAAQADADNFSVELANGVQFSDNGAAFFRYQPGRLEYHLGIWDGDNGNAAIGLGYPVARGRGKLKFRWVPGVAMVQRKTDNLGTHGQFYNRFEFDYKNGQRLQAYLAWTHYSNGSKVFNHDRGPNLGENFITLGFRLSLGRRRGRVREQQLPSHDISEEGSSGKPYAQALPWQNRGDGMHLAQQLSQRVSGRYATSSRRNQDGWSGWDRGDP